MSEALSQQDNSFFQMKTFSESNMAIDRHFNGYSPLHQFLVDSIWEHVSV